MTEEKKLRVAVLFGGRSAEHSVSILSARFVLSALDPAHYQVIPIGIDREGRWLLQDAARSLGASSAPELGQLDGSLARTVSVPLYPSEAGEYLVAVDDGRPLGLDIVSPSCTARWARMAACRGCSSWLAFRTSALVCSRPPSEWTRT
ncbi:MAG: D-alanine--D-alanine ligase [Myxococcaceae bacterium]|nr:D-alanine--D-alanine ligase [Myxococcaceae bacterium]